MFKNSKTLNLKTHDFNCKNGINKILYSKLNIINTKKIYKINFFQ